MAQRNLNWYYKTMFSLSYHHRFRIEELEDMLLYELDLYTDLLASYMREQEQQQRTKMGVPI